MYLGNCHILLIELANRYEQMIHQIFKFSRTFLRISFENFINSSKKMDKKNGQFQIMDKKNGQMTIMDT